MEIKPTPKVAAGLGWGVVAILIMGATDQLLPGVIDWGATVMGVPYGAAFVYAVSQFAAWLKSEIR